MPGCHAPGIHSEETKVTTNAIKLTSPHELLAVVPYLLGFNPTNSIVVVVTWPNRAEAMPPSTPQ